MKKKKVNKAGSKENFKKISQRLIILFFFLNHGLELG